MNIECGMEKWMLTEYPEVFVPLVCGPGGVSGGYGYIKIVVSADKRCFTATDACGKTCSWCLPPPKDPKCECLEDCEPICFIVEVEGIGFCAGMYAPQCPTEAMSDVTVTWSGPVEKVSETCAKLKNDGCFSKAQLCTITATVKSGTKSATCSREIMVPASPGYWEEISCDFQFISCTNTADGYCAGINCFENGQAYCDAAGMQYFVISEEDGILKTGIAASGGRMDTTFPCQCNTPSHSWGNLGGVVVADTTGRGCYMLVPPLNYCMAGYMPPCGNGFSTGTTHTISYYNPAAPYKTFKWRCY